MYGRNSLIRRGDPLEFVGGYEFVAYDKRFGGVAVYKATNKVLGEILRRPERVPHTQVHYCLMSIVDGDDDKRALVGWTRQLPLLEIEQAVATLIMMGKEPVLVRAFTP
jgi:hypothetical protein